MYTPIFTKRGLRTSALLAPALALVLIALVLPTLILVRYSFNKFDPSELMIETITLQNYVNLFRNSYFHSVIGITISIAGLSTVSAIALGFPVAYRLARTQSRYKSVFVIATVFPLLVGNVVRAAGWMAFLGHKGFLGVLLAWFGMESDSFNLMNTWAAVFVGTLSVVLPFMILILQGVLENIDFSLEEAGANLGASPFDVFTKIIFPLALPGVSAGAVLVFILCMNAYTTPFLLGGPAFKMMAPALYQQITVAMNWPFGAALAVLLMIVTVIATIIASAVLRRASSTYK